MSSAIRRAQFLSRSKTLAGSMVYAVIYEPTKTGYCAYSPDVMGCIAAGGSFKKTQKLMSKGLHWHINAMIEDGDVPPVHSGQMGEELEPGCLMEMVEVRVDPDWRKWRRWQAAWRGGAR